MEFKYLDVKNLDKFREAAIAFEKDGRYCQHAPGTSAFFKYWKEQESRCLYGYKVGEDYISGYNYFYWNFSPIQKVVSYVDSNGVIRDERTEAFPDPRDYDKFFFDYIEDAERNGNHAVVLKSRGQGYSFKGASMLNRNYFLIRNSKSYAFASDKQYLTSDGLLTKAWEIMDFIDQNTAWAKRRHYKNTLEHRRASRQENVNGVKTEVGYKSEIIGVSVDDPNKAHPYSQTVYTPDGHKLWKDIKVGSTLFTESGETTTVSEIHEVGTQDIYEVVFNDGRIVRATEDHLWNVYRFVSKSIKNTSRHSVKNMNLSTKEIQKYVNSKSYIYNKIKIPIPEAVNFNAQDVPLDAYTLGLMLGDGSIGKSTNNQSDITMKHADLDDIKEFIPFKIRHENWGGDIRNVIFIPNGRNIYKELNLFDKKAGTKFIPDIYKYNSQEVRFGIINGLLDTDGSVTKDFGVIEYSTKSEQMAKDFMFIVHSLGLGGKISSKIANGVVYYRCYIYCNPDETRLFNLKRKKELLKTKKENKFAKNKRKFISVERVTCVGKEQAKCVTVTNPTSLYLIGDMVVTHNCRGKRGKLVLFEEAGSFKDLLKAYQISRPSVETGNKTFGTIIVYGTGGDENLADAMGLEELFFNPEGYRINPVPNIWSEGAQSKSGFFVPVWANMQGYYDEKTGISNKEESLKYHEEEYQKVLKNAKDTKSATRYKAENCVTPEDAVLRVSGSIFPTNYLKQRLSEIVGNPKIIDAEYVGELVYVDDKVTFKVNSEKIPIRNFPTGTDKPEGAVVIWEMPVANSEGEIPYGVYIAGTDPYDDDESGTDSLGSTFVMNVLTNRIVAEYTGRPATAKEYYENVLRLLKFYNATCNYEQNKKGMFGHFEQKNSLYYLADTPKILRDMDIVKTQGGGNRSKGTTATEQVNKYGRELIKAWLLENAYGEDKANLYTIKSIPLLKELIYWNKDQNFDRVSCLGMLLIYREDRVKFIETVGKKTPNVSDDPFFDRMMNKDKRAMFGSGTFSKNNLTAGNSHTNFVKLLNS